MRRLVALSAVVCGLLAAPPAFAHHDTTVSVTVSSLTLDPPRCKTYERRPVSRCDGTRVARVNWSGTCGARPFVTVNYRAMRAGGGRPIHLASEDATDELSGSTTTILEPGAHVYATVTMECHWADPDGTGPPEHTVTRSATSGEVVVPPWLTSVSVHRGNYCNFNSGGRTVLQARQRGNIVSFSSSFIDKSLLGSGRRTPAAVRKRWLNARGARLRLRRHPEVFLLQELGRREPFSGLLRVNTRAAGWIKFWEEVGGVRSNTLAIRAVPARC